ncbi:N-acetylgalactosaminyltransferase 7 [Aplysia californica]|uniref:Polypeptide N-acetylgalactosaminyltransferase n=1 Tax=Aplysia californica TaxID=6500 RepID=A0ABM0K0C1_APLCA|nr:N-acetylgalactosaminyltransferase 7 [Aplysia californica]
MARRGRYQFVIKLGIVVIFMLLLGPYLFHLKLSDDVTDDAELYRQWQLREKKIKSSSLKVVGEKQEQHTPDEDHHENVLEKAPAEKPSATLLAGVFGNFEPKEREIPDGPGENGASVKVPDGKRALAQHTIQEFGFNMVASDQVAMDRVVPDTRLPECKFWKYPEDQPQASVILVFHNEGFSTLVRTIHSVINTSPPQLLKEVVLVDDYSTKAHLKGQLENYIKQFGDLVKLYRNSKREGLIRTRTRGAELSRGDVIVFLDAHCECNRNWLVPLLDRIRANRKTMAVPIVDGIDWDTMAYNSVYGHGRAHHRGIFEWGFLYKENKVPKKELARRKHESEPYRSPTHAGGLFAMDRKYFFELGGYDPGLKIWGGENYELSFKIWQCGGIIEWVPCSRVGHIYRNHMPYSLGSDIDPQMSPISINYMRVVEVWMDPEFREYFYTREPSLRGYPIGNITGQLNFKKEHKCKSFKWFMDNVAYDVFDQFPRLPPNKAWGEVRLQGTNLCWDAHSTEVGGSSVGVGHCHGYGSSQQFRLNERGQIGIGERCIMAQGADKLHITYCSTAPVGPWEWDENTGIIRHHEFNKCVEAGADNVLHLKFCNAKATGSRWVINEVFPWKKS